MRPATRAMLSDYLFKRVPLNSLREFLWGVDWDDRSVPEDERSFLLKIEAICSGIDEGLDDEDDLRQFLLSHGALFMAPVAGVSASANNVTRRFDVVSAPLGFPDLLIRWDQPLTTPAQ